jgi:hypothetical protein
MADNPQTEVEVINDTGSPLPVSDSNLLSGNQVTKIKGASDGTEIGNVGDALKVTLSAGKKTYTAVVVGLSAANLATDFFSITGASGKKVEIIGTTFSATKNNTGLIDLLIVKRSTANSGGTSTTISGVPHDSGDAAASATVRAYTVNPTLGTLVGNIYAEKVLVPSTNNSSGKGAASVNLVSTLDSKPLTLKSASEVISFNFNGVSHAGNSVNASFTWIEEDL